ncbi:MAG: hypothetical protein ACI9N0_000746 [Ilumatobacter sp.]|jgi:hypothetical protein
MAFVAMGAAALISACGSSADEGAELPDGVAVAVVRDRSGESEAAQFHDVPLLLVSDDGVAYMDPPVEFAVTGELLPDVWVRSMTPVGLSQLLVGDGVGGDFVPDQLGELVGVENLGPLEFYLPDAYLFTATPVAEPGDAPVLVWPATASIALADVSACERLPESEVGEAFETAAAGSLFEDGGVLYRVLVKQAWPGATC